MMFPQPTKPAGESRLIERSPPMANSENQKRKRRAKSAAAKKLKKKRCQDNGAIPQMAVATMARLQAQQPMLIGA